MLVYTSFVVFFKMHHTISCLSTMAALLLTYLPISKQRLHWLSIATSVLDILHYYCFQDSFDKWSFPTSSVFCILIVFAMLHMKTEMNLERQRKDQIEKIRSQRNI